MDTKVGLGVVVGVDGSDSALRAVRWAADEATRRREPLRLVTVFSWTEERRRRHAGAGRPATGTSCSTSPARRWRRRSRLAAERQPELRSPTSCGRLPDRDAGRRGAPGPAAGGR